MKSHLRTLLELELRLTWRRMLDSVTQEGKRPGMVLVLFAIPLAFLPLVGLLFTFAYTWQQAFNFLNQPGAALVVPLSVAQLAVVFFGMGHLLSLFFFDTQLPTLLAYPLRPRAIALSRFLVVVAGEYLTALLVAGPFLLAYGLWGDPPWTFWLLVIPLVLILPLFPLALGALLAVLFVRALGQWVHRETLRVFGIAAATVVSVVLVLFINRVSYDFGVPSGEGMGGNPQTILALLRQHDWLQGAGSWLPLSLWEARVLSGHAGWPLDVFFLVAVHAIILGLFWVSLESFFFSAFLGLQASDHRRRFRVFPLGGALQPRSMAKALFWREAVLITRSPILLLNTLVAFLLPLIIAIATGTRSWKGISFADPQLEALVPWAPFGAAAAASFLWAVSGIPLLSLSKEGRYTWISLALPAPAQSQVAAKTLFGVLAGLPFALLLSLPLPLILPLSWPMAAFTALLNLLAIAIAHGLGLYLDMERPFLTWTDPQQAVKGNTNSLILLLLYALLVGAMALLMYLAHALSLPLLPVFTLLLLLVAAGGYGYLLGRALKAYAQLAG
ncbi:MAG: hypothetical protein QJR00_04435 [Bacillota bacterium]|nr:hypothetical protein [Bacillota bacterium]